MHRTKSNARKAPDRALQTRRHDLRRLRAFLAAVGQRQPEPHTSPEVPPAPDPAPTAANSPWSWDCVALHETGSDWTAHGPSYSSALGVMNEAVRENAPADVAERILNGTATKQEQIDMAQSVVDRHGVNAWAPSTVAYCS